MNEICEIVPSQKENDKINVRGYLMVQDKIRKSTYYWCCKKRKLENCRGRATTIFLDGLHYLKGFTEHHYSPQASNAEVAKSIVQIKQKVCTTRDKPVRIIQYITVRMSQEYHPYMPSSNSLHSRIKRVRRSEMPPQPQTLEEINIPDFLQFTFNGDRFLVRDFAVGEDRILLFTTQANIQHLSQAPFWMMDGTFKTVPVIFSQLYTIHAPVGGDNSRVLPLVYSLVTSKSVEIYRCLFEELLDFAIENNIDLQPSVILTDFEQASIIASRLVFPRIRNKGCFFHLGQSGWRKIQSLGLATRYGDNEQFSLMLCHLFALAFLPSDEIPEAFNALKLEMPPEADEVVKWFEEIYVHGKIRRHLRNGNTIHSDPLFPPQLWSVFDSIDETGVPRTQNIAEAWHRRWDILLGQNHVGLYTMIEQLQK
ncbi:unnamed protein product [Rhizophagus irregularis]|nr:unnamed protein product [Rhizophagus irregularis]CAB5368703.1 unnamed protein product [Rhizophagus irregularis]